MSSTRFSMRMARSVIVSSLKSSAKISSALLSKPLVRPILMQSSTSMISSEMAIAMMNRAVLTKFQAWTMLRMQKPKVSSKGLLSGSRMVSKLTVLVSS